MKRLLIVTALLSSLLASGSSVAQQEERHEGHAQPCPHPTKLVLHAANPVTYDPSDFIPSQIALLTSSQPLTINQTQINKAFAYTFKLPGSPKECCLWKEGSLTVTIKALQAGPPGSATSANDSVSVVSSASTASNKLAVGWSPSPFAAGATLGEIKTHTFVIPAYVLDTGHVSFIMQDDSALVSAVLTVEGCCLHDRK